MIVKPTRLSRRTRSGPRRLAGAETSDDRQAADRVAEEDEQRPEMARGAETSDGRHADNGATQRSTLIPAERATITVGGMS